MITVKMAADINGHAAQARELFWEYLQWALPIAVALSPSTRAASC